MITKRNKLLVSLLLTIVVGTFLLLALPAPT